jgi:hypothetical protein
LFNAQGDLIYEHRDRAILGFAADMSNPLTFLSEMVADGDSLGHGDMH